MRTRHAALTVCFLLVCSSLAMAQSSEPIRYTLRFPAPHTHYVEAEAIVPTAGQAQIELMMAVWTPGSYLVREYERNLEAVKASADGRALGIEKTAKNRWRVTTGGSSRVTVSYRVYAREMTVRSNWVDADFAMLNGAPTFLTLVGGTRRPHDVRLVLPAAWKTSVTSIPAAPGGEPHHYLAADYDRLVDSPIVAGNPDIRRFDVQGKEHLLVDVGAPGTWNGERAAKDLAAIVAIQGRFWGGLPYDKYVFFNVLTGGGGAIEHADSVMMMSSRWAMSTRQQYLGWLSTMSHEFFHLWNVKRLRPVELGPFDYERENYTRSLWIAEGLTDYYADLMLVRAGLISPEEHLRQLSEAIRTLQTTPGRLVQTTEMASYDAWIKAYRPDENSDNVSISYYTKGSVVGFLLDAEIRRRTDGRASLDDVMRLAFKRYSGERGYTPDQFREAASEIAGSDMGPWFRSALDTTGELDYAPALDWFALRFAPPAPSRSADRGSTAKGGERTAGTGTDTPGWLGARTRIDEGRLLVAAVPRETPAWAAGLNVDDEIVAIGDFRVGANRLGERLEAYSPGERVTLLVARREELKRLEVTLGAAPRETWRLEAVGESARRAAWLRGS